MLDETRLSLVHYRLDQAQDCLKSALREVDVGSYKSAANRAYYCIFHAIRAVLAIDGFDSKKHSGLISTFQQKYIKTLIFPIEFSKLIRDAFNSRGKSDYEDFFIISKSEITEQVDNASKIFKAVEAYIKTLQIDEAENESDIALYD